jgi:MFS family permease
MQEQSRTFGMADEAEEASGEKRRLSPAERRSLFFLLASIVLWFFGYNAVTSKYSVYASNILHKDYNLTLILAQAAAILAYLPVGLVSSRVGRRKAILAGVVMLTAAFGVAGLLRADSPTLCETVCSPCGYRLGLRSTSSPSRWSVERCSGRRRREITGFYFTRQHGGAGATPTL